MPEPPDFDQIARQLFEDVTLVTDDDFDGESIDMSVTDGERRVAEQLRLVWNARGAADRATLATELGILMGPTMAGPYVTNLDRALRTLDR